MVVGLLALVGRLVATVGRRDAPPLAVGTALPVLARAVTMLVAATPPLLIPLAPGRPSDAAVQTVPSARGLADGTDQVGGQLLAVHVGVAGEHRGRRAAGERRF